MSKPSYNAQKNTARLTDFKEEQDELEKSKRNENIRSKTKRNT